MKRFLLLWVGVLACCYSIAKQPPKVLLYEYDEDESQQVRLKFEVGYVYSASSILRFNQFRTTYNRHFSNYLSDTLGDLTFGSSPYLGIGFGSRFFTMQINYNRFSTGTSSTFVSGEGREYQLALNSYNLEWGFVVPLNFPLTFGFTISGSTDRGILRSGYRYQDGSISYAADKQLNGLYHIKATGFNAGAKLVWQTNWGDFFGKYEYYGMNLSGVELPIKDNQDDQGSSLYDNHILTRYHTDDIQWSDDSKSYFVGLYATMPNVLRGHKYTIGITYYLKKK